MNNNYIEVDNPSSPKNIQYVNIDDSVNISNRLKSIKHNINTEIKELEYLCENGKLINSGNISAKYSIKSINNIEMEVENLRKLLTNVEIISHVNKDSN